MTCVGYTHKRDLPQLALITYLGIGMTKEGASSAVYNLNAIEPKTYGKKPRTRAVLCVFLVLRRVDR